jgi:hypothetical protein
MPPYVTNLLQTMGPNVAGQQVPGLIGSAGLPASNDNSSAMHQLSYGNPLHGHPAMVQMLAQNKHNSSSGYPFAGVDQNAINALFLAAHRPNGESHFSWHETAAQES